MSIKLGQLLYALCTSNEYVSRYIRRFLDRLYKFIGIAFYNKVFRLLISYCAVNGRPLKNEKQLVFVVEHSQPRVVKIIKAICESSGFNIVVILNCEVERVRSEFMSLNVNLIQCRGIVDSVIAMTKYSPIAYYIFTEWFECVLACIATSNSDLLGKIIVDRYDVLNDGYIGKGYKRAKKIERFALENADGIVWRYFAEENLKNKGFAFKGKTIQFIDWCNPIKELSHPITDDYTKIKICYVCAHDELLFDRTREVIGGRLKIPSIMEIMERIDSDNVIFDVYVWKIDEIYEEQLKVAVSTFSNLHIFTGIEHEKLIDLLKEYDYGCRLYTADICESADCLREDYDDLTLTDSFSNAYMDYIEAGLPVISTIGQKHCNLLDSYGALVRWNLEDWDEEWLLENRSRLKSNVRNNNKKMTMNAHIGELIDFILDL